MSSAEVLRRLHADGWVRVHQKGSHVKLVSPCKPGIVVVPHPRKDLPAGTLRAIFRQAGWS
ncbi:MAG: type II toxin-antitoxin system HicA family toxin [Betaproteobacteria bacterium]|nr:type II toxin-antitoxin system HicA family toxin [Betaproteobacteria bacterium]PWB64896.1 MAG: toxin HicA [Betaproteobacteria bacterium]